MTTQLALCSLAALPDGQARGFDPQHAGQDSVLLVRRGQQVYGWRDACPHEGTPMAWRRHAYLNGTGTHIACHAHGALFEIDTGLCVQGPCLGQSLSAVPTEVGADRMVYAALPSTPNKTPP